MNGTYEQIVVDLIGKAIAGATGAAVSNFLDRGKSKKLDRLREFAEDLQLRLSRLEAKSDPEIFVDLTTSVVIAANQDSRDHKLTAFKAILEGAYSAKLDSERARMFIDLISRFGTHHLHLVKLLRDTVGTDLGRNSKDLPATRFFVIGESFCRVSGYGLEEGLDIATLGMLDLVNCGLVETRMQEESCGTVIIDINPIGLLRMQVFRLSRFGQRFAEYVQIA